MRSMVSNGRFIFERMLEWPKCKSAVNHIMGGLQGEFIGFGCGYCNGRAVYRLVDTTKSRLLYEADPESTILM